MTKKSLNQNDKNVKKFFETIEPEYIFANKPINRFKFVNNKNIINKIDRLSTLKKNIASIQDCNLKNNSKNLIMGNGEINSPIMIIGETPGELEEKSGKPFQGDVGKLLEKMLIAINLKKNKIYLTYSVNFRPPEDRKPSSQEMRKYSVFLKEHISIIDPKLIILMGSTAMETVTGLNTKISNERGNWKEIIIRNKTIPLLITYSPSYLIRFPDNKKYSWEDLKKIRQKISDLNIQI